MFIYVAYKDAPELSVFRRKSSDVDVSVEKILLVNPKCPVRIMLEFIRKKCKFANLTQFDLCDESGILKGLFNLPTYAYATKDFEHKKTYYLIVLRPEEKAKDNLVLPQLNRANRLYGDLQVRVKKYLLTGDASPPSTVISNVKVSPPPRRK